jgi:polyisoprenoid-binding protein YceI
MSRVLFPALLALSLAGCADPAANKSVAIVEDAPSVEVAATAPAPDAHGTVLSVDRARSKLGGIGAKVTAEEPFSFSDFDGTVTLDGDTVSKVAFTAKVASIQASNAHLTDHLKREDFLFADRYPTATFESSAITPGSDAPGATHTVTGVLTIRGKSKQLTFPATITTTASDVTAKSEFVIDRRDFDVVYPGKADDLVQDKVVLQIAFVAPRAAGGTAG